MSSIVTIPLGSDSAKADKPKPEPEKIEENKPFGLFNAQVDPWETCFWNGLLLKSIQIKKEDRQRKISSLFTM